MDEGRGQKLWYDEGGCPSPSDKLNFNHKFRLLNANFIISIKLHLQMNNTKEKFSQILLCKEQSQLKA